MQLAESSLRQVVPQEREVAIGVAVRRDALVDLVDRRLVPGEIFAACQLGEHLARGVAAADGQREHAPGRDCGSGVLDDDLGGAQGH